MFMIKVSIKTPSSYKPPKEMKSFIKNLLVLSSCEVHVGMLRGEPTTSEEGGGGWLHPGSLHGAWQDAVCK